MVQSHPMVRLASNTTLTREQIDEAIKDPLWQAWRRAMLKMKPVALKLDACEYWLSRHPHDPRAKVQVVNYVNALKRGGLI